MYNIKKVCCVTVDRFTSGVSPRGTNVTICTFKCEEITFLTLCNQITQSDCKEGKRDHRHDPAVHSPDRKHTKYSNTTPYVGK